MKKLSIKNLKEKLKKSLKNLKKNSKIDESKIKDKDSFDKIKQMYTSEVKNLKKSKNVKFADKKARKRNLDEVQEYVSILGSFKSSLDLMEATFKMVTAPLLEGKDMDEKQRNYANETILLVGSKLYTAASDFAIKYKYKNEIQDVNNTLNKFVKGYQENYKKGQDELNNIIKNKQNEIHAIEHYLKTTNKKEIKTEHLKYYKENFLRESKDMEDFIKRQLYLPADYRKNTDNSGDARFSPEELKDNYNNSFKKLAKINENKLKKSINDLNNGISTNIEEIKNVITETNDYALKLKAYIDNAYNELIQIQKAESSSSNNKPNTRGQVAKNKKIFEEAANEKNKPKASAQRKIGKLTKERLAPFEKNN